MSLRRIAAVLVLITGCATTEPAKLAPGEVRFTNATPGAPRTIPAVELKPDGPGPFPAVLILHGCHGVLPGTHRWARWFREQGYVALVPDSWTPRGFQKGLCTPDAPEIPSSERLDDVIGALAYLHTRAYVDPQRIGVIGWSNGGVFSIAAVNGPTHERAAKRGVRLPPPGFKASIGVYPGGCFSLVKEKVVRPTLLLLGGADDWTPASECTHMADAMRERGADIAVHVYPGAHHYFDDEDWPQHYLPDVANRLKPNECCGATVAYDAAAAGDARRRVAEFFAYHLRP